MKYIVTFDATGVVTLDADDEEHAEFLGREYALENYPELQIGIVDSTVAA
jgi:hypothetical protein